MLQSPTVTWAVGGWGRRARKRGVDYRGAGIYIKARGSRFVLAKEQPSPWLRERGLEARSSHEPHLLKVLVQRKLVVIARVLALLALGDGSVKIHRGK